MGHTMTCRSPIARIIVLGATIAALAGCGYATSVGRPGVPPAAPDRSELERSFIRFEYIIDASTCTVTEFALGDDAGYPELAARPDVQSLARDLIRLEGVNDQGPEDGRTVDHDGNPVSPEVRGTVYLNPDEILRLIESGRDVRELIDNGEASGSGRGPTEG